MAPSPPLGAPPGFLPHSEQHKHHTLHTSKGPVTVLIASHAIEHYHASAAGITQRYHLYHLRECEAHMTAYNGARIQLCQTFKISSVAHNAV